jgi:hypothetical protein
VAHREIWEGMDWISLVPDRDQCQSIVNMVQNSGVPWKGLVD